MLFPVSALLVALAAAAPLEKRATTTTATRPATTTTITSRATATGRATTVSPVVAPAVTTVRTTTVVSSVAAHVVTSTKTSTVLSTSQGKTSTIVRTSAVTTTLPATTVTRTVTIPVTATTAKVSSRTTTAAAAPTSANLYPRLIVPVITGAGAQGTSYFVTLSSTEKTDLLYDIAASSGYKTCTLVGRFPVGDNPTSSGAYGSAQVQAELLVSNIATTTSSSSQPAGKTDLGTRAAGTALNGANAVYASFPVTAGTSVSIALTAVSGSLTVFEDYNTVSYLPSYRLDRPRLTIL